MRLTGCSLSRCLLMSSNHDVIISIISGLTNQASASRKPDLEHCFTWERCQIGMGRILPVLSSLPSHRCNVSAEALRPTLMILSTLQYVEADGIRVFCRKSIIGCELLEAFGLRILTQYSRTSVEATSLWHMSISTYQLRIYIDERNTSKPCLSYLTYLTTNTFFC
jgi:hypothetical protein